MGFVADRDAIGETAISSTEKVKLRAVLPPIHTLTPVLTP
jgi:hypothetical protein